MLSGVIFQNEIQESLCRQRPQLPWMRLPKSSSQIWKFKRKKQEFFNNVFSCERKVDNKESLVLVAWCRINSLQGDNYWQHVHKTIFSRLFQEPFWLLLVLILHTSYSFVSDSTSCSLICTDLFGCRPDLDVFGSEWLYSLNRCRSFGHQQTLSSHWIS